MHLTTVHENVSDDLKVYVESFFWGVWGGIATHDASKGFLLQWHCLGGSSACSLSLHILLLLLLDLFM